MDAASRSLKASERFWGHLAVFTPTRTRSALFVKCFFLFVCLFLRDIDFILFLDGKQITAEHQHGNTLRLLNHIFI